MHDTQHSMHATAHALVDAAVWPEGEAEVRVVEEDRKPVFTTWQPLVDAARQRCNHARAGGDGRDHEPTSGGKGKGDDKCVLS